MQRREFFTLLGSAAAASVSWPLTASAQTNSIYRLGTLGPRDPFDDKSPFGSILIRVLAQRGYTLGQNLALDARGAMGDMGRVPQLLQEMKADKVDAFVVTGFPVALAAKTLGIPTVVAFGAGDPVATGLVQSLSRPGGNITGISDNATELSTKRLSLLKQLNPNLRRVAMLWNKNDLGMSRRYEASANVAPATWSPVSSRARSRVICRSSSRRAIRS
jgi:putative ABC transport system substrate-binding protein